jgi:shikimate dehydrogenase
LWERRLAVLGSPIAHSKSPDLHRAAYRMLGLDWGYEAIDVREGALEGFLAGLDDSWRGLSLTMPLKREVLPLLGERDPVTELVGAANTVLFDDGRVLGFNTDVHGARMAIEETCGTDVSRALVLGAGATAASVLAALAGLGTANVTVATRSPARASELADLAERLAVTVAIVGFDAPIEAADVVVSTLPGTAGLVREFPAGFRETTPLLDIAYDPWPTAIGRHWLDAGGAAHSGLGMLLHQAHAQVRIFVGGDPATPLERDAEVLSVLRGTLGGAPGGA